MMTTIERNRLVIETYFNKIWNEGHLRLLEDLIAPDYVNHSASIANPEPGPKGLYPIIESIRKGFPDLHYEIKDLIITDDKVVARVVMTGTLLGELWGIAPNGKRVEVNQVNIERIADGKIREHWRVTEELLMMKQLGVVA
ncbi:MAG TPA: ester cyclase [Cyclobacteriaceae bacterium]|nr:ester cyclase [Cyclobacteriaceae bacterium]